MSANNDIAIAILDPYRYKPEARIRDDCLIEFYEGFDNDKRYVSPLTGLRPKLAFQTCAASGIADLEHILDYMDGYHIVMLSLLFERQFPVETKSVMKSLPNVRFLHINNFRWYVDDVDKHGPIPMLCDSLDLLPSLETLSVVYDPTWTLPWIKLSYCLARRPS